MKKFMKSVLLLMIALSISTTSSIAEQVEMSQFTLAGRGIHEKSGSWVALQCLSSVEAPGDASDCHSFQHLYFDVESGALQKIGPIIPNDQNLQKTLKKMGKDFRKFMDPNGSKASRRETLIVMVPLMIFFGPLFLSSAGLLAAGAAIKICTTVGPFLLAVPFVGSQSRKIVLHSNQLNHPLQDQDGWNWSVNSKRVRHKTFASYVEFLKSKSR